MTLRGTLGREKHPLQKERRAKTKNKQTSTRRNLENPKEKREPDLRGTKTGAHGRIDQYIFIHSLYL